ncbi:MULTISPECIES: SDR family oxidoreductase [Sphingobium]|jgi:NAD(P)-dependent dehydrogenase (short-subunit alcohol dehydrogenase family)|uniref:SDR family oxidoreductase n=1 Tax=Sphingobium fuliginis (strain ATCC 27551) TaxID=336203 RepID=A0A292ZGP7_SPHSA|nr:MULTISPECIES: SDR family oxidoreductase [Sphingobium]QOT70336.1 SDR family oxidoreductase [Sphingobium fuliginis]GAY21995.1 short-chain dehydrogenase [Sphingobium fuliginis]
MNTVLITGCSTGFGRDTALHFLNQGWNVVATMRDPAASTLPASDRLRILPLDVTDMGSIAAAVAEAGPIDVLVNNAGVGWLNAVEGTPLETVRAIFETNLFGAIAMMQAVLPGMRARRAGVIVNVSSSSLYKPLPLLSVYRASKAAMNALTESAAHELAPFGIRVRIVMPGMAPSTSFGDTARGQVMKDGGFPAAYADYAQQTLAALMEAANGPVTVGQDVADAVYRAATDPECPAVLPAGADAVAWARDA